jgi:hypothetical protein
MGTVGDALRGPRTVYKEASTFQIAARDPDPLHT